MRNKRKDLNVGVMVTLSGRWPRELPERRLKTYGEWITGHLENAEVTVFDRVVCTKDDMLDCIDVFKREDTDLVILVYGAFTGDDICCGVYDALKVPLILWAPREEFSRDERMYANALCSASMNGASLTRIGAPHHLIFGNSEEERAGKELQSLVNAYRAVKNLRGSRFGMFGYRPTAFYNCAFDETVMRRTFGIDVEETDLKVVFDRMNALTDDVAAEEMAHTESLWDVSEVPDGHLDNHVRLYLVLKQLMDEQGYDYATIKCWPEMGNLHTQPCAVLGRLIDDGYFVGCEGDMDVSIVAAMENIMTDKPAFITDLINVDESENTVTFWHCGNAAPSLHDPADGIKMANHPLVGQGTAFYAALKPGKITAARFSNIGGQYRLFILRGEAVPTVRNTKGCMVNVKVATPVMKLISEIAENGMSHHYSVVWEDIADDMIAAARILDIPVIEL